MAVLLSSSDSKNSLRLTKDVIFRVRIFNRLAKDIVYLVGDSDELGNWTPHLAKPLRLETIMDDRSELWSLQLRLSTKRQHSYRYFTGRPKYDSENGVVQGLIISAWEGGLQPLSIMLTDDLIINEIVSFSTFGDENRQLCSGWLLEQVEVRLRLYDRYVTWSGAVNNRQEPIYVKCVPVVLPLVDAEATSNCFSDTLPSDVVTMNLSGVNKDVLQGQTTGVLITEDYTVFKLQTFEINRLAFRFDFFSVGAASDTAKSTVIGSAFLEPLRSTSMTSNISIIGPHSQYLGSLRVDTLVIRPLTSIRCDMSMSYVHYFQQKHPTLHVGHRGLGSSFRAKEPATQLENTLSSLMTAGKHGAAYVEFDVHLTKDNVPVIYHDFTVCLVVEKTSERGNHCIEIPIKELTLAELQSLKLEHVCYKDCPDSTRSLNSDCLDSNKRPFPTLRDLFEKVDIGIGFNVEVKYPLCLENGTLEDGLLTYTDRNDYVDRILEVILRYAGQRRVIISCFDPDVCTMLRLKQNKYPIMFLTCGEAQDCDKYADPRTRSVLAASSFVQSDDLLGICSYTQPLLQDLSLIDKVKGLNQVLWCWGSMNMDAEVRHMLKARGMDGIIFDCIDQLMPEQRNILSVERQQ
jgi:glycerophosphocholine phosphodiesterase GPCPD1